MDHSPIIDVQRVLNVQAVKPTIGWKELIDLPEFGLTHIPAKIDTGARTSVLHCSHIRLIHRGKKRFVEFVPLDESFPTAQDRQTKFTLPFHSERNIKNSFGQEESRYVVKTIIRMFDQDYPIEISLRDRSDMEFPMLLGRSFIRGKFLVNVAQSNLNHSNISKS